MTETEDKRDEIDDKVAAAILANGGYDVNVTVGLGKPSDILKRIADDNQEEYDNLMSSYKASKEDSKSSDEGKSL